LNKKKSFRWKTKKYLDPANEQKAQVTNKEEVFRQKKSKKGEFFHVLSLRAIERERESSFVRSRVKLSKIEVFALFVEILPRASFHPFSFLFFFFF
jgi:hypothetical protein